VIDESSFLCVGLEQLMPVDAYWRIWCTTTCTLKQPHFAPEIQRLKTLPSYATYKAAYYSLGSLITFCLAVDDEKSTKMPLRIEFMADTKLYWFILRCIDPEPSARLLLFVWGVVWGLFSLYMLYYVYCCNEKEICYSVWVQQKW
jgi:hypothetical protein